MVCLGADHAELPIASGDPIPGTTKKIASVSSVYVDGDRLVFEGSNDDGAGYGVVVKKAGVWQLDGWVDTSTLVLKKKSSLSGKKLVFIASDAIGDQGIFGVADVTAADNLPIQILGAGETLPGVSPSNTFQVADIVDVELVGSSLVANIKKASSGRPAGEGLYHLPNFPTTTGMELILGTAQLTELGYIGDIYDFSHNGKKAIVSMEGDFGPVIFVTEDLGRSPALTLVADTATAIPFSDENFSNFGNVQLRKKAAFEGRNGVISGIYYTTDPGVERLSRIVDTTMDVPGLVGKKFTRFDGISVDQSRFLFVGETSDGGRSVFSGLESIGGGTAKREIFVGMDVGHKILETIHFNRKSLGSVLVASQFDDGSSGVVLAESSIGVPSFPGFAMLMLMVVALLATGFAATIEQQA